MQHSSSYRIILKRRFLDLAELERIRRLKEAIDNILVILSEKNVCLLTNSSAPAHRHGNIIVGSIESHSAIRGISLEEGESLTLVTPSTSFASG
jgi:hypothetical protein